MLSIHAMSVHKSLFRSAQLFLWFFNYATSVTTPANRAGSGPCRLRINAAKRAAGSRAVLVEYQTRREAEAKGRDLPASLGAGQCTVEAMQLKRGGGS